MVKWSDFIPPEYAPVAYGLGAAAAGGGLGWLYDKLRGKKHTARRVGIGALLGLLGGAGYGQSVLNGYLVDRDAASEARGSEKQRKEDVGRLNEIARYLGLEGRDYDASSLRGDVIQKVLDGGKPPSSMIEDDFERINEQIINAKAAKRIRESVDFVRGLKGKRVIAVPDPLSN